MIQSLAFFTHGFTQQSSKFWKSSNGRKFTSSTVAHGFARSSKLLCTVAPIDLFSDWAASGRDEVMADGHRPAVREMMETLLSHERIANTQAFSFVDIGCGNGWVALEMSLNEKCTKVLGVDGAKEMIKKARKSLPENERSEKVSFHQVDISDWTPSEKLDVAFSMECLYYLQPKQISSFFQSLASSWMKEDGLFIMGIDHYYENSDCHSWAELNKTHMTLWTERKWKEEVEKEFDVVKQWRAANRDGMKEGTLVILAKKRKDN